MSDVKVKFLHDCGADRVGEVKTIDATRAKRLGRTGYIEVLEQATKPPSEKAAAAKTPAPAPRAAERRG